MPIGVIVRDAISRAHLRPHRHRQWSRRASPTAPRQHPGAGHQPRPVVSMFGPRDTGSPLYDSIETFPA